LINQVVWAPVARSFFQERIRGDNTWPVHKLD